MIIATFGPTTGWSGKTITLENEQFILDGHGPISAADVMTYDSQGHLVWATEGTRGWVGAKAQSLVHVLNSDQAATGRDASHQRPIESYAVIYRGGHPAYPRERAGKLHLRLLHDRFQLEPSSTTKWFAEIAIAYDAVLDLSLIHI